MPRGDSCFNYLARVQREALQQVPGRGKVRYFGFSVRPPLLLVYGWLSAALGPCIVNWECWRHGLLENEKKHRMGAVSDLIRHQRQGTVLWLHGASVGESTSALNVARALGPVPPTPIEAMLFTASSPSAVRLLASRMPALQRDLPGVKLASQFVPIDTPNAARNFLQCLQPVAGVFIESDIWPNLVHRAALQGVPLALLDARISDSSAQAWRAYAPSIAKATFSKFSVVYAQSVKDARQLTNLGAHVVKLMPSMKFASGLSTETEDTLAVSLQEDIRERPTWIAASTHPGDEAIVLAAHRKITSTAGIPNSLLILVPRHPNRSAEILKSALSEGAFLTEQLTLRSQSKANVPKSTCVYIVDSLGELHSFYDLSRVAFVGNSMQTAGRGHNFAEAAHAGLPVLMGPHTGHFSIMKMAAECEVNRQSGFGPNSALQEVVCSGQLADAVVLALRNTARSELLGRALRLAVHSLARAATAYSREAVSTVVAPGVSNLMQKKDRKN
jgi:3-deoxy-D-manno-octulosonic-acid transferase